MRRASPPARRLLDRLEGERLSVLVERDGREVYRSSSLGVRPLLELVDRFPQGLPDATVADRIVGGCAAQIFVHLGVNEVVAGTVSEYGRAILAGSAIRVLYDRLVPEIRNRDDSGVCPFELMSCQHGTAGTLLDAIRARLAPPPAQSG